MQHAIKQSLQIKGQAYLTVKAHNPASPPNRAHFLEMELPDFARFGAPSSSLNFTIPLSSAWVNVAKRLPAPLMLKTHA